MIIIELTYKKPLDEVNALLQEHRDFLEKYYLEKRSSPKVAVNFHSPVNP